MWIQTVTVRKRLSWVVTSVTLTFDLWPWPFAWTSLLSLVINPDNFMMVRWWEHGEKGVTDGQTDGQTDRQTDGLNQSYSCLVAAKNTCMSLWLYSINHSTYQMYPITQNKVTYTWNERFIEYILGSVCILYHSYTYIMHKTQSSVIWPEFHLGISLIYLIMFTWHHVPDSVN